jgi:hypothetical protein
MQIAYGKLASEKGLILAAFVAFSASIAAGVDNYQAACQQADARISAFEQAVRSGDQAAINRTGLQLQADPLAVRRLNASGSEGVKIAHNNLTDSIKNSTMDNARTRIAQQYNVKPEQVTFYGATNPQKPGEPVKVGQDWDVTARVNGRDVPLDVAKPIIHNSYYDAAGGKNTFGDKTPAQVAHQQAVEVTTYQHSEAYGGSKTEGQRIIEGPKDQRLRDPTQLSEVIKYKSDIAAQQAESLQAQGRGADAEGWRVEEARQGVKQFDRQVQPRVEALGGEVPNQVREGMNVLRDVEKGKLTPEEARIKLQGMGETPASIIDKSAGLVEASQTLKPPSERGPAAPDVFVDNVKDRLEMNRAEGRAPLTAEQLDAIRQERGLTAPQETGRSPQALTEGRSSFQEASLGDKITTAAGEADSRIAGALGAGELSAGALGTRQALNAVGETTVKGAGIVGAGIAVVETARESFQGGRAAGEGLQALSAGDMDKAGQKFSEAADKGKNVGIILAVTAAAEAMPQTAALIGAGAAGYQGGRYVLENTRAGQAVDKGALNTIDRGMQAAESLPDALRNIVGIQTRDQRELTQKQETYLRALASGRIELRDGVTVKDVMDQIKYGEPGTYNQRMNELITRNANAQPDKRPGDIAAQLNELASRITDPNLSRAEKDKAQFEYLQILNQIKNPKDQGEKPGEGGEVAGGGTNAPGTEVTGGDTNEVGGEVTGSGTNEPGTEVIDGETNVPGEEVAGGETNAPSEEGVQGGDSGSAGGETEVTSGEDGDEPTPEGEEEEEITPEEEAIEAGSTIFGGEDESDDDFGQEPEVTAETPEEASGSGDGEETLVEPSEPSPEGDDLATSEAGYGETADGSEPPEVDPNTDGGIQQFAQNHEEDVPGADDYDLMGTASQGNQASTAGDDQLLTANNVRNQGGADAQQTVNQGASEIAQGDAENSWGNTLGNSLQQGLEQGLGQAATTLGTAAADGVTDHILPPTHDNSGDSSDSDSGDTDSSSTGASTGGGGGAEGVGSGGGGGGAPPSPPPPSPPPPPPGGGGGGPPPGSGGSVVVTGSGTAGGGGSSGASGSGSGGYAAGAQDQVLDGSASLAGRTVTGVKVTLTYNAYGIPDCFQIVYGGGVIGDTGNTSGGGTIMGNGSGSSPQVTIRVISNQQDQDTIWDWTASAEFFVTSESPSGGGAPVIVK